jgi:hypothetical protein
MKQFKILMLIGKFSEAIKELNTSNDFFVESAHFAIALSELNILKTRFRLLSFIEQQPGLVKGMF